jgi:hypothetical protein
MLSATGATVMVRRIRGKPSAWADPGVVRAEQRNPTTKRIASHPVFAVRDVGPF